MKRNAKVSTAVIRRLPRYYRHLSELQRAGVVRISSSALGKSMGLTASQIRQDLFCFGEFGQQGYGYKVDSLKEEIGEILGINRGHTVVVMGTGNLGRAIIQNFQFSSNGFRLLAAFDVNPQVVGTKIAGVPVYHADELEAFVAAHPVSVGMLTVSISAAQSVCDRLVNAGVRGIWNFTNHELAISRENVVVESVHFSDSLLTLSYLISQQGETAEEREEELP
ncbi:redox-sensing transcriptional repressor Rex [Lawsonibacter sp. LCP25S3_G6]|uniref:redox-sensing transcriptional repressor Rex n=1 Tax=unclassified Lawsonibacter TaxID=2617946 RepID=UPI003F9447C0